MTSTVFVEGTKKLLLKLIRRPWTIKSQLIEYNKNVLKYMKYAKKNPIVKNTDFNADLKKRDYVSYDQYISHQREKYNIVKGNLQRAYERRRAEFISRFRGDLGKHPQSSVLCLGARDGVEVDALRQLGLLAIGIDVEHPQDSSFVVTGDFHNIPFPSNCFDFLYTNCLDHIFDPATFFKEAARIIKNEDSQFLIDVPRTEDIFSYESFGWNSLEDLHNLVSNLGWNVVDISDPDDGSRVRLYLQLDSKNLELVPHS